MIILINKMKKNSSDNFFVSKLRVTFLKHFVEEYRKIKFVERTISKIMFLQPQYIRLFQK